MRSAMPDMVAYPSLFTAPMLNTCYVKVYHKRYTSRNFRYTREVGIHLLRHKIKPLNRTIIFQFVGVLCLVAVVAYAAYMNDRRLSVNPATYQPLLHLIGQAESNNNYNAYFGNASNATTRFTDMTLDEVLKWQQQHIKQGSLSSAVGRYQIVSNTLKGLIDELGLELNRKFDPPTQDQMAIALLERRGAEQYVNQELTDKQFAANLAQEWAALPKTVGDNPSASYYDGDGLNASRVKVGEVLQAIKPISAQ